MITELYKYKLVLHLLKKKQYILSIFKRRLVAVSLLFTVKDKEYDGYNNTTN